ncbi:GNAT family N-acetyltransferase [Candidatus Soleaferrea massiliensis]|uniref:GNAT family N-acetyltransferase n=1 Tax=Candidatus Soleaferrea massiliensis TaxID=1470354 RepID=UPI000694D4C8|nr:GNAT family N-acetyltransferase [Candidatus Soleaferrea massiliensis]
MIRFAQDEMKDTLKHIWSVCFKDPGHYIDYFFENRFKPEQTLVWLEDEKPAAMLSLLPCELIDQGERIEARYIYAVATLPEYRGRGISTHLLKEAQNILQREEIPISLLVPAEKGLFDFYRERGYETMGSIRSVTLTAKELKTYRQGGYQLGVLTAQELYWMRGEYLDGTAYLSWDIPALGYALGENGLTGGRAFKLELEYGEAYMVCHPFAEHVLIREIGSTAEMFGCCCDLLLSELPAEKYTFLLPSGSGLLEGIGEDKPFGMACWNNDLHKEMLQAYLGLMLN